MKLYKIEREATVEQGHVRLKGILAVPPGAQSIVVFAHGSGSSRYSSRNNYVARVLQSHKIATLLMDLLTPEEAEDRDLVFDIGFLAKRLNLAAEWLKTLDQTKNLRTGFFGASTGAGAALVAAAHSTIGHRAEVRFASLRCVSPMWLFTENLT